MNDHHGPLMGERDGLRVIDCRECGYGHLDKFPSEAELDSFYVSDFCQKEKAGALERYLAQREWMTAHHTGWLQLASRHTAGGSLLDVGCGYGFFIADARSKGWTCWGIEPNSEAANYAQQHTASIGYPSTTPIWRGGWDNGDGELIKIIADKYDCISALWLIEHLPNPLEFLKWAHSRLVIPGGVLLVAVPNDFTHIQMNANAYVRRPFWWIDKTHLNYFTPSSIANLLGLAGFQIVERQTMFEMESWLTTPENDYTDIPEIGDEVHGSVRLGDMMMTMNERLIYYGNQARCGIGREIILIAKAV